MRGKKNLLRLLILVCMAYVSSCSTPTPMAALPTKIDEPIVETQTATVTPTQSIEPADIIFHNGNVITIEKAQPLAEAVAIRGNLIQVVGSEKEVMAYQGSETVVIDLQGNTLMPGFTEGHTHYTRNGWGDGIPLETMMQNMLAFGLTSITEMHSTDEYINAMLEAEKRGEIEVRINIMAQYNCGTLDENRKSFECTSWYKDHPPILDPTHMVRIPGVKIFVDGAGTPARGGAYMSFLWPENITDYWPDIWDALGTPYGDLYLTEEELTPVLQDIQDRGYRAALHTYNGRCGHRCCSEFD